jgi:hypothetical protein
MQHIKHAAHGHTEANTRTSGLLINDVCMSSTQRRKHGYVSGCRAAATQVYRGIAVLNTDCARIFCTPTIPHTSIVHAAGSHLLL